MRLIDAEQLSEAIHDNVPAPHDDASWAKENCLYEIDMAPTVDAVPVVRCRECKHRYTENCPMYFHDFYWLEGYGEYVDDDTDHTEDDYFCPKGERKEGADNEP